MKQPAGIGHNQPPISLSKLSPAMRRVIINLANGRPAFDHLYGRSMHGGAGQTQLALVNRGLVELGPDHRLRLTALGQELIVADFNKRPIS